MASNPTSTRPGPRTSRSATTVLGAVSVYTALAAVLLGWVVSLPTILRIPIALPVLLFTPGYAIVSALFPLEGAREGPPGDRSGSFHADEQSTPLHGGERSDPSLAPLERGILAVVVSIAIVPAVMLAVMAVAGLHISLVLAGVTALTVAAAVIGVLRAPA